MLSRTTLALVLLAAGSQAALSAAEPAVELKFLAASSKAIELEATESLRWPMRLPGPPILSGATLELRARQAVNPVSVSAALDLVATLLPFLELSVGAGAGSGWDIGFANGLGVNERSGTHGNAVTKDPFRGVVTRLKAGAALQFDAAALAPGDWNHVVARAGVEIARHALSGAPAGASWLYKADLGENRDGWVYAASFFLGYKMPIRLELVGFSAEAEGNLYDTPGRLAWGDDLAYWNFGPLLVFRAGERTRLALVAQFHALRNFKDGTGDYGFYQDRVVDRAEPYRLAFNRAVLSASIRLGR